jgi:hypothetical protein
MLLLGEDEDHVETPWKSTGRGVSRDPLSIEVPPPPLYPLALSLLQLLFLPTTRRTHYQRPSGYSSRPSSASRSFATYQTSSESPHRRTVHGAQTRNSLSLRGGRRFRTLVTPLLPWRQGQQCRTRTMPRQQSILNMHMAFPIRMLSKSRRLGPRSTLSTAAFPAWIETRRPRVQRPGEV